MENKPKYLYRGITLNYDLLQQVQLYGVEIKPHYEPLIDQFGRKTVSDGNEYGVYMTDNLTMAEQAYGNVNMMDRTNIRKDLILNVADRPTPLMVPAVGVIYKIDTTGLDVHKPWISSQLTEHYNNGFQGDEWIVESIPPTNYSVVEVTIGPDWLHDAEKIDVSNIVEAQQQIRTMIEKRKQRLEILGMELEKLTPMKRMQLTNQHMQLYRDLFGTNGVRYVNNDDIQLKDGLDYTKYLLSVFYHTNLEQLDYTSLMYIETLKSRLNAGDSFDKLIELINSDMLSNDEKRQVFIDKKEQIGEVANTVAFDTRQKLYDKILRTLTTKKTQKISINDVAQDELKSKVEQEHFMKTEPTKEELIRLRYSLKGTKNEMLERGFEMPNMDDIFDNNEELENKEEKVENIGRGIK